MTGGPALHAAGLVVAYGDAHPTVVDAEVAVDAGTIVGIVGPNGAGKSTLLQAIFGIIAARSGTVEVGGIDVTAEPPHERLRSGLAYLPQRRNVFGHLTVADNLRVGGHHLRPREVGAHLDRVVDRFPVLAPLLGTRAGRLSGGQRQVVALARALMTDPTVVLLDEPTAGLAPRAREEVVDHIIGLRDAGVGVVLVEQDVRLCLALSDHAQVYDRGVLVHEGRGEDLVDDPVVERTCLGRFRGS